MKATQSSPPHPSQLRVQLGRTMAAEENVEWVTAGRTHGLTGRIAGVCSKQITKDNSQVMSCPLSVERGSD